MSIRLGPWSQVVAAGTLLAAGSASAGLVDVRFSPTAQTVPRCGRVEIDLVVASNDDQAQPFDALDAVISWDPTVLDLVALDQSRSGAEFLFAGFLPDPDGINDDTQDGEAIFTALARPGEPIAAPPDPDELIVITFRFRAIALSTGSDLSLVPMVGKFGETRVLFEGGNVTGDISSVSITQVGTCPGDVDAGGEVEFEDILLVLGAWGPCAPCCPEDQDTSGVVDFTDLLIVLANWGPCP